TTHAAMISALAVQAAALESQRLTGERTLALMALRFCRAGLPADAAATALGISRATLYRRWVELQDLLDAADDAQAPAWLVAAADQARAGLRTRAGGCRWVRRNRRCPRWPQSTLTTRSRTSSG